MKITFDRSADAVYIALTSPRDVEKTYPCDPRKVGGEINLDFDSSGRLLGIEVMDASRHLTPDLLQEAEIIG
jgi:uncharacterized protein YuzE